MSNNATPLLLALLLATALSACGKKEEPAGQAGAPQASEAAPAILPNVSTEELALVDPPAKYTASCASCHGALGEGVAKNPKLAGLKRDEIKAKLVDYRDGKQMGPQTAIMATTAKTLSDAEIEALGTYIGE